MFSYRLKRSMLTLLVIALLLIACNNRPSPREQINAVAKLSDCFPMIERLQLVEYGTGAQEIFHYRRGFLSKAGSSRTYYDPETRSQKSFPPFDAQAQADLADLEAAIVKTGVRVSRIAGLKYDAKGKIVFAEFDLTADSRRFKYVFSAQKVPISTRDTKYTLIHNDWYFVVEDWN